MIEYFNTVIKPASDRLQAELDKVNDLTSYTDKQGITHVYVMDSSDEYELINGAWVKKAPF